MTHFASSVSVFLTYITCIKLKDFCSKSGCIRMIEKDKIVFPEFPRRTWISMPAELETQTISLIHKQTESGRLSNTNRD